MHCLFVELPGDLRPRRDGRLRLHRPGPVGAAAVEARPQRGAHLRGQIQPSHPHGSVSGIYLLKQSFPISILIVQLPDVSE